jgi:sugar diacid utilization regulator
MRLVAIFNSFIHVVQENPNYLIGLLDMNHRVIAASDENVCGEVIPAEIEPARNQLFPLQAGQTLLGYLWVHVHQPDAAFNMVSTLFYQSLKTRIAHELDKESALASLSMEGLLINELVVKDAADASYVQDLMAKLDLDPNVPRIAVYLLSTDAFEPAMITNLKYKLNDPDTFYAQLGEQTLVIFKALPVTRKPLAVHKVLTAFVQELVDWGLKNCYYAIGTLQCQVRLYADSYQSCQWLVKHETMVKDQPCFFTDHLAGYFCDKLQISEMDNLFDYFYEQVVNMDTEEMVAVADALYRTNFNLKQAADQLYFHRNTLLYKLQDYEQTLKLDIRGSMVGKFMFFLFCDLLKKTL